eukprot:2680121-Amphidinium_carterae.1
MAGHFPVHWQGTYVDDLLLATIVSARLDALLKIDAMTEHRCILHRVTERYAEVGLVRKEAKANEALVESKVWGRNVSSTSQSAGVLIERRSQVMRALAVAHEGPEKLLQVPGETLPRDEVLHDLVDSTQLIECLRYKFGHEQHIMSERDKRGCRD